MSSKRTSKDIGMNVGICKGYGIPEIVRNKGSDEGTGQQATGSGLTSDGTEVLAAHQEVRVAGMPGISVAVA